MGLCKWLKAFFKKEDRREKPQEKIILERPPIELIDTHNTIPIDYTPELYYPDACVKSEGMETQGEYPKGHPIGCVVHFNAGRFDPIAAINWARKQRYCYFIIDRKGAVYQDFPLNRWGYHAGKSEWKSISKGTVHHHLVGIEVMAAGQLSKKDGEFKTWWGDTIPPEEVRTIEKQNKNQLPGHYHAYTDEQEVALTDLIMWLNKNGNGIFRYCFVLGHDEVCVPKGRKNDPGGALSLDMPYFRKLFYDVNPPYKKNK